MADNNREKAHPVATWALYIGLFATILGIVSGLFTLYRTTSVGEVKPIQPLAGYAHIRGIDPTFEGEPPPEEGVGLAFPSDHLVLPLEWSNNTGTTVLVKQPALVLTDDSTKEEIKFFFVGQLSELSPTALSEVNTKPHDYTTSLVLEPHTVKQSFMVFRVNDWTGKNRCFRFHQGQRFQAGLQYERHPQDPTAFWGSEDPHTEPLEFGDLPNLLMLETANWLSPYGKEAVGWDYISSSPGARAANSQDLPEDDTPYYQELEDCS